MKQFRLLRADEIECRVGSIDEKGFNLLLYKNARVDQNILDETFGMFGWGRDHKELKGVIYCGINIYDEEKKQWVIKWDSGAESFSEKEKGEASDSFKRAGVNWGIGRELYTAPFIYVKDVKTIKSKDKEKIVPAYYNIDVAEIDYTEDRKISHLVITGDGKVIFTFNGNKTEKAFKQEAPSEQKEITLEDAKMRKTTKGKYYYELDDKSLQWIVDSDKASEDSKKCASMVLEDRKQFIEDGAIEITDGDLPF